MLLRTLALSVCLLALSRSLFAAPVAPDSAARGVNQLAVKLFEQVRDQPGNLVMSPYSIAVALAMVREGARGTTESQMAEVLGIDREVSAESHASLLQALLPRKSEEQMTWGGEQYSLRLANRVWIQTGFVVRGDFLSKLVRCFVVELGLVDFKRNAEDAQRRINEWVEGATEKRIEDILPQPPHPQTRLALVNAIHFKAGWDHHWMSSSPESAEFHSVHGNAHVVEFMRFRDDGGFPAHALAEFEGGKALEMSVGGGECSVVILLPDTRDGLAALEGRIEELEEWMGKLAGHPVDLWLPRFEAEGEFDLVDTLRQLGMPLAFDAKQADFSAMAEEKLHIGAVRHKAWVKADEKGIEAAAATLAGLMLQSADRRKPKEFRVDHPFLFVMRHRKTGTILFLGRIADVK